MKKVRMLRDMWYGDDGEIFGVNDEGFIIIEKCNGKDKELCCKASAYMLVQSGWGEWVEEPKSLVDAFKETFIRLSGKTYIPIEDDTIGELAKTAKKYYLGVFEKAIIKSSEDHLDKNALTCGLTMDIRKALEED